MKRNLYAMREKIKLFYAEDSDRKLIYDMAFEEDEIWKSMFDNKDDFDWSDIHDEESYFFSSTPGLNKYLLIEYDNQIVGTISYTYNDGKISNMELDMWLRSMKYTGKGIGSKAMKLLIDSLIRDYEIGTFIIRPWVKNPRAIKAYEKCGFVVSDCFNPKDYYGKYFDKWGQGDYPEGENVNMVLSIE
ncbi:GNAT family N-acetyltransferase [Clostridioides sp. ZZV15-6598]|uniref:GNAT family N-acetyltransferase n=1 Tax=Clostridioides sp. ZZV15-6598 TaxID=2811501 RepID=UPI001D115D17|nr:GNAT family N-acetyltransferase [Clostridioides sp. ZZV15-6598]